MIAVIVLPYGEDVLRLNRKEDPLDHALAVEGANGRKSIPGECLGEENFDLAGGRSKLPYRAATGREQ
jgi:hypothetical protein